METRSLLPAVWEVPKSFRERLGTSAGRQRTMFDERHLLLVLHAPPKPDDTLRRGRFIWRKPDGSWTSNDLGGGIGALGKHLAEYAEVIQQFDRLEEEAQTAADYFAVLEGLAPVLRAAAHLHQTLQEARRLVPEDRDLIIMRDQAYDLERTADLLYTNAKNALDFAIARRAEEESRSSRQMALSAHRLNILAAFFFPLATLSAIFGVNLLHGLEDSPPPLAFLLLVGSGLAAGAILAAFITRRPPDDPPAKAELGK